MLLQKHSKPLKKGYLYLVISRKNPDFLKGQTLSSKTYHAFAKNSIVECVDNGSSWIGSGVCKGKKTIEQWLLPEHVIMLGKI